MPEKLHPTFLAARRELADLGVKLEIKDEHALWKVIDWTLKIISFGLYRKFMTGFLTTIGDRIAVPRRMAVAQWGPRWRAIVFGHEMVHVEQFKKYGIFVMFLLYVLLPFPVLMAIGRYRLEFPAYVAGEVMRVQTGHKADPDWIAKNLTGFNYFYTLPPFMRGWVRRRAEAAILAGAGSLG
jgi:hypothetical protein